LLPVSALEGVHRDDIRHCLGADIGHGASGRGPRDERRIGGGGHLQAQVSDALMRDARLAGLVLTPTAHVPTWGSGPATIEITDVVLRVAREEAARLRPDVQIEDRLSVRHAVAA